MGENPIEQAMNMAMQMNNAQFNAAKLTIKWYAYGHQFAVESLNPVSAFEMAERVKKVAKERMEEKPKIVVEKGVKKK